MVYFLLGASMTIVACLTASYTTIYVLGLLRVCFSCHALGHLWYGPIRFVPPIASWQSKRSLTTLDHIVVSHT